MASMSTLILRHATVGDTVVDVAITDGAITDVGHDLVAAADAADAVDVIDLTGHVLAPAAVEPHTHLDKAFLANVVPNPSGDLGGAIAAMREAYERFDVTDTARRAVAAITMFARNGATIIRTHVDVTEAGGLEPLRAVLEARDACRAVADVEIVALCGFPVLGPLGVDQRALLGEAMDMGADLVGGCPHLEQEATEHGRRAVTEMLVGIAAERGVGLDLHTDETLDPEMLCVLDLVDAVANGFSGPVTASHCVSLSVQEHRRQREIADAVAGAGIGIVALPQTNLYLQGRATSQLVPRAITPIAILLQAGVAVAAGQDNVQDPFNPIGRADPLETASLLVAAAHVSPDVAYELVSDGGRQVLGRGRVAIEPGSPADLVAFRASSMREAIAMAPGDRRVFRHGIELD